MALTPWQGNDRGLGLAPPGCRLLPECIFGVLAPSARPRHHQQVIKSPAASSLPREPRGRNQEQLPMAVPSPVFPTLPTDLRYGRNGGGALSANGQLVTKPTSFLKLGHRIETGTAELSPNRTVAHLVPGPLGTPGRGGGGAGRWPLPRIERKSKVWRVGREVNKPQSALIPSPFPQVRSKSWKMEGPLPLTPT